MGVPGSHWGHVPNPTKMSFHGHFPGAAQEALAGSLTTHRPTRGLEPRLLGQLGGEPGPDSGGWESSSMKMRGEELAVAMETDSGWVRHAPVGDPWGECHSPPGFTVDGKRAALERTAPAVLVGSVHLRERSRRHVTTWQRAGQFTWVSEGLGRGALAQRAFGMAPATLSELSAGL